MTDNRKSILIGHTSSDYACFKPGRCRLGKDMHEERMFWTHMKQQMNTGLTKLEKNTGCERVLQDMKACWQKIAALLMVLFSF